MTARVKVEFFGAGNELLGTDYTAMEMDADNVGLFAYVNGYRKPQITAPIPPAPGFWRSWWQWLRPPRHDPSMTISWYRLSSGAWACPMYLDKPVSLYPCESFRLYNIRVDISTESGKTTMKNSMTNTH